MRGRLRTTLVAVVVFSLDLPTAGCGGGGGGPGKAPGAPTALNARATSATRVDLDWRDNSPNELGFRIERRLSGAGAFSSIGSVGVGATTFADSTAAASTAYDYRVLAFNAAGDSPPSNVATVTTPAAPPGPPKWTVMVFMAADNNLETVALEDINEMEAVGSTADLNIVVEVDTYGFARVGGSATAKRLRVIQDTNPNVVTSPVLQNLGEIDTANPLAVEQFVVWAKTNFPADRYVLVLWDHAGGLGFGQDVTSGTGPISYSQLDAMFRNIQSSSGIAKFDIVGFDACLMGTLEIDHMLAAYASFRVASEESEPASGWRYDDWLAPLKADTSQLPGDVASTLVDTAVSSWLAELPPRNYATLSAVDLGSVPALVTALATFATDLRNKLTPSNLQSVLAPGRRRSIDFDRPSTTSTYSAASNVGRHVDLDSFCRQVATNPNFAVSAGAVSAAIAQTVVRNDNGYLRDGCRGVSIHYPNTGALFPGYTGTKMAAQTEWDEFLTEYIAAMASDPGPPVVTINSFSPTASPSNPASINFSVTGTDLYNCTATIGQMFTATEMVVLATLDLNIASEGTHTIQWDPRTPFVSDGTSTVLAPVKPARPGSNLYYCDVRFDVNQVPLHCLMGMEYNRPTGATDILDWHVVEPNGLVAPIVLVTGDQVRIRYDVIDLNTGASRTALSSALLTVGPSGFTATEHYLNPGNLLFRITAQDWSQNLGQSQVVTIGVQ